MINFNTILSRCNCMNIFSVFRCHTRFIVAVVIILAVNTDVLSSDALKERIESGNYQVDGNEVARRLMQMEQDLS